MIGSSPVYGIPESNRYTLDPLTGYYFDNYTGQYVDLDGPTDDTIEPAEISDAQNRANLAAASAQAILQAGISESRENWTGHDAANYVQQLRGIILANPGMFTEATVQIAERINSARVADYSHSDPNKPIDPNMIVVAVTDQLQPIVDMITPAARIPGSVAKAADALLTTVNNLANALQSTSKASPLLTILLPAALVIWGLSVASGPINNARSVFSR